MQNNIVIFKGCECTIEERRSFLDAQDFCIQKRMALLPCGEKFVNEIDNYNSNEYLWIGKPWFKEKCKCHILSTPLSLPFQIKQVLHVLETQRYWFL